VWLAKSPVLQEDSSHTDFTSTEFLKKVAPLDPVKWLPTLTSTRVRIQQVKENDTTPGACQEALRKAAPKQAEIVDFDHVNQLASSEGGGRLFSWIKDELKRLPVQASNQSLVTQVQPQSSDAKKQPAQDH